jgi:hypothetical protein
VSKQAGAALPCVRGEEGRRVDFDSLFKRVKLPLTQAGFAC